jgi:type III secretion protein U
VSGARTEQPTPRRLREARRKGDVVQSRELTGAAAFAGGLLGLAASAPSAARALARLVSAALAGAATTDASPVAVLRAAAAAVATLSLPAAGAALGAAALAGGLQAGFVFAPGALLPRLERVDPFRGLRRLLSPAHAAAVLLAVVKAAVLLAVAWAWLRAAAPALAATARLGPSGAFAYAPLVLALAGRLAATFLLFGLADLALSWRRHRRALRMTPDEVRREHREEEGDPAHRAERRRVHRALVEAGPIARATVVVVNPTHVAVALRHDRASGDAPCVVAKGTGPAAARIRSAARRAGVPIVRDVALARAIHRLAEVGDELPEELYDAAAAVLAHLYGHEEVP